MFVRISFDEITLSAIAEMLMWAFIIFIVLICAGLLLFMVVYLIFTVIKGESEYIAKEDDDEQMECLRKMAKEREEKKNARSLHGKFRRGSVHKDDHGKKSD